MFARIRIAIAPPAMTALLLATLTVFPLKADDFVWGINASFSGPHINEIDVTTGTVVADFVAPNPIAASGNGRGIAVAGNTVYYSLAGSGDIFVTNSVTHADGGVLFNTGLGGVATITWDGANLWVSAYDNTNNVYKYDLAGHRLATVSGFGNDRDGLEVLTNGIIANRGDGVGPYDLYNLSGTLVTSSFLNPAATPNFHGITTGVTFDGTDYFVSNPDSFAGGTERLLEFDSTGAFVKSIALPNPGPQPGVGWLLEDLASLGNTVNNPPGVPEPGSVVLLATAILGLGMYARRSVRPAPNPKL
jgi:hypothetical protein